MKLFSSLLALPPLAAATPLLERSPAPAVSPAAAGTHHLFKRCPDSCENVNTRWNYWWYGVGGIIHCADQETCGITKSESTTMSYSTTVGFDVGFPAAGGWAHGLSASYTWSQSYSTSLSYTLAWHDGKAKRL